MQLASNIFNIRRIKVKQLSNSALSAFSEKWWESRVQHAEKIQDEDFTKEII
jgi:hypothetical protein